jgi:XRE family transcriptional regulator, fatty acid utilization regulator
MSDTQLGQIIRHARKLAGLRLEDVAERVGVTAGALSHIESGRRLPTPHNAVLIAEALGIPSEELLTALDHEHSSRRCGSVQEWRSSGSALLGEDTMSEPVFRVQPIEALFGRPEAVSRASMPAPAPAPAPAARPEPMGRIMSEPEPPFASARSQARWSTDTSERIAALDELAASAHDAIRTLRGLVADEDPAVAHEAARLLRELDVRGGDE